MSEKIERLTLAKAITRGLEDAMEADRTVVMLGEDIGKLGGVYRVTEGLQARFATAASWMRPWVSPALSAPPSVWPCVATVPCRRFSSTASCSPPTTRSRAAGEDSQPHR